jgi:multidrug efflux pump subunit AcrA (membrane-fusion protein)
MQQWRELQDFESKLASAAARIAELEAEVSDAHEKADKCKEREAELLGQVAGLKERVVQLDEQLAASSAAASSALPSTPHVPVSALTASAAALCLSPQHNGCGSSTSFRIMSPVCTRPPRSPCSARSDAALAAAEAQVAQVRYPASDVLGLGFIISCSCRRHCNVGKLSWIARTQR